MALSREARSLLSEQFAEIFRISQDEYRELLNALRDDDVDMEAFAPLVDALRDKLITLKRIRTQLAQEKRELRRGE